MNLRLIQIRLLGELQQQATTGGGVDGSEQLQ
jgi:hypothetical protein